MAIFQELNSISNELDTLINTVKVSNEKTRYYLQRIKVFRPSKSHLQLPNSSSNLKKMPILPIPHEEAGISKGKM